MKELEKYISQLGDLINNEIKYTVYHPYQKMLYLLLVDYIKDTLENYDYRNCPNYDDKEDPIKPEYTVYYFELERGGALLLNDEEPLYYEFNRDEIDSEVVTDEDNEYFISLEAKHKKYLFDKELIESYLRKLVKDINCYG